MSAARARLAALALLAGLAAATGARASGSFDGLYYLPGSSGKVEQLIGDRDWADTLLAVTSRTLTSADVLGNGLGYSFVSGDSLLFLFGDTIGATSTYVPTWAPPPGNPYRWLGHDPIASSRTTSPDSSVRLTFFKGAGDTTLYVQPRYPDGTLVDMGPDDIPNSGLDLGGRIDLVCSVGTVIVNNVADHSGDSSIVVGYDPVARTFTAGRTLSRVGAGGHFVFTAPHLMPMQFAAGPTDTEVLIYGTGLYRQSDIYLSMVPKASFESGVDAHGVAATRYFTGLSGGAPAWSDSESAAYPVMFDDPLAEIGVGLPQNPWPNDDPTIGNLSVAWAPAVGLWLMTFDGGRQSPPATWLKRTEGIYFSYAAAPWGPWAVPQLIFNPTRDGGYGTFIRKYDHSTGIGIGPAGPTIGSQTANDPDTTSGATFAPQMIEPMTRLSGDTLSIDYTLSTWNPYTVVRLRSRFLVLPGAGLGVGTTPLAEDPLSVRPNPFHGGARVRFALAAPGAVTVEVLDVAGRRVRELARGPLAAGAHELSWDGAAGDGRPAPAGLYFVRLRASGRTAVRRVVRLE